MFAKLDNDSALALEDHKGLSKFAQIPKSNAMYGVVEEWLKSNDWAEIPEGFFDIEISIQDQLDALDKSVTTRNLLDALLDNDADALLILKGIQAQKAALRAQL